MPFCGRTVLVRDPLAEQKFCQTEDEGENSPVNCFRPRSHENKAK